MELARTRRFEKSGLIFLGPRAQFPTVDAGQRRRVKSEIPPLFSLGAEIPPLFSLGASQIAFTSDSHNIPLCSIAISVRQIAALVRTYSVRPH